MKSNRLLFLCARIVATVAGALVLGLSNGSLAVPITVPTELNPGDQYRLAFLTFGVRDATSSDIADYDTFVNAQASTESALDGITWQVIGSTASVSARDHTGTGSSTGVPIYLLNDTLLAENYADLWDGSIQTSLGVRQDGTIFACGGPCEIPISATYVPTGSDSAGEIDANPLGAGNVRVGIRIGTGSDWISFALEDSSNSHQFYAISELLTVPVPEPGTAALLGLAALLVVRGHHGCLARIGREPDPRSGNGVL